MADSPYVFDVDDAAFASAVVERSHEVAVVVDFWAAWCGPCRILGPMLEASVDARGGRVLLAKVDVDANPATASAFRVRGIPQVFAFRGGRVTSQFTGVVPQRQLDAFLDALLPTPADEAVARARAATDDDTAQRELRQALEHDAGHRDAAVLLAERLVEHDPDAALALVVPHRPDPAAEAIVTRVELARNGGGDLDELRALAAVADDDATLLALGRALAAEGQHAEAIDALLAAVELHGPNRDTAREQLVALFGLLGDADDRVRAARPRLARALF